jgi:hypothetical protein
MAFIPVCFFFFGLIQGIVLTGRFVIFEYPLSQILKKISIVRITLWEIFGCHRLLPSFGVSKAMANVSFEIKGLSCSEAELPRRETLVL